MKWLFLLLVVLNVGYFSVEWYPYFMESTKSSDLEVGLVEGLGVEECLYLSFKDEQFMGAAYKKLAGSGVLVEHKSYFTVNSKEYWLIGQSFSNLAAANEKIRQFSLKSIDAFVLKKEGFENTLSFGVFSSHSQAKKMQSNLMLNKIEVQLKVVEEKTEDKWLKILNKDVYKVESTWLSSLQNNYFLEENVKKSCN